MYKLKLQWQAITHPSFWQMCLSLAKSTIGKELRKWDCRGIVGGNKNWHNLESVLPYLVNVMMYIFSNLAIVIPAICLQENLPYA